MLMIDDRKGGEAMDIQPRPQWVLAVLLFIHFSAATSSATEAAIASNLGLETPLKSFQLGIYGRKLLQTQNASQIVNVQQQSDDTVRIDPLHHLKKYRGGYDIRNKHYWSSTIFTGAYGFGIGALWLICGLIFGGYLLVTSFCLKKKSRKLQKRSPCHKQCYLWPVVVGTAFVLLAIIASGVALGGETRLHSRAKTIMDIIIDTADEASTTIHNVTAALQVMSESIEASSYASTDTTTFINATSKTLNDQAVDIERQAKRHRHQIQTGLDIVYIVTTAAMSLNLAALVALSASGTLRLRRIFYTLIILCWCLTTLCWLLFGAYYFLKNFSGDTCTALEDFQQNPGNSSLSSILPCDELLSAKPALQDLSQEIYDLVHLVNANISLLRTSLYPNLEYVCNPFSGPPDYVYQPENCSADTIKIGDIPQVLKTFTCVDTNSTSCKQGEFTITTSEFNIIEALTTSVQSLVDSYPEMDRLVDCQIVKDAFSDILAHHCKPLKRDAKMTWVSMLLLSVFMVILVPVWATGALHDRRLRFSDGSVKPHPVMAPNMVGSETKLAN
ncbi:hypothetical protein Ancab_010659 [Ancistrocladus abbreviatus]